MKIISSRSSLLNLLLVTTLFFGVFATVSYGYSNHLKNNFYKKTCPDVEKLVYRITRKHVLRRAVLPAKLLRVNFHDCFVRGCDASVLLNSTKKIQAEKDAPPNVFLEGFDVIDEIKTQIEKHCPGVVSCADIIALSARDAVSIHFQRQLWKVRTGRRDGKVSSGNEASLQLPNPFGNFTEQLQGFTSRGLNLRDLVVLSGGGHTIGIGHCFLMSNRLYNFTGKGDADPSLDRKYAAFLRKKCKNDPNDFKSVVDMDPGSAFSFDNNYYYILKQNKGLFTSDATLLTNGHSLAIVNQMLHKGTFFRDFSRSMTKLSEVQVLTGKHGEIRKKCSVVNKH